jgi:IclR family transcriptional regulator, KDG regulon repressor
MQNRPSEKLVKFKRVPAVDKCFRILELLSDTPVPLGITEIAGRLNYNKSTVFNIIHTLLDLDFLSETPENKVILGLKLHHLSRASDLYTVLISNIRPFLEEINRRMRLSVFLGIRSGLKAVIIDKVDSPHDLKVSSEVGMKIPLIAGSHGRALLAHLSDGQLDTLLSETDLRKFTLKTPISARQFKREVQKVREDLFAFDDEGYLEGIRSLAIPILLGRADFQPAIWTVGLKNQISNDLIPGHRIFLKQMGERIEDLFSQ